MTQKEIYELEKANFDGTYLHREGIFWKAYEKSAFRLVALTYKFKPLKKYINSVGISIVSVGFPCEAEAKYANDIIERTEKEIVIQTKSGHTQDAFDSWNSCRLHTQQAEKES